jgi:hypothetical protein
MTAEKKELRRKLRTAQQKAEDLVHSEGYTFDGASDRADLEDIATHILEANRQITTDPSGAAGSGQAARASGSSGQKRLTDIERLFANRPDAEESGLGANSEERRERSEERRLQAWLQVQCRCHAICDKAPAEVRLGYVQ